MTYFALTGRTPFLVRSPYQLNLSNHQPIQISTETKKLMPTIIRLARLMEVADPDRSYSFQLNSREELEVQIRAFRNLVDQQHFPLFAYEEEEWIEQEEYGQNWQGYHPLLDEIPVHSLGFSHHDVEPESYGDLVALLYWLGTTDLSPPRFDCDFKAEEQWNQDSKTKFNPTGVLTILEGMDLKSPFFHLPGLIRTVLHETDTFFLDACPLCGGFSGSDFEWTASNFTWLREDWLLAKPIHEGNEELIKWSSNSIERLTQVSMILKKAHSIHKFHQDQRLPDWCQ